MFLACNPKIARRSRLPHGGQGVEEYGIEPLSKFCEIGISHHTIKVALRVDCGCGECRIGAADRDGDIAALAPGSRLHGRDPDISYRKITALDIHEQGRLQLLLAQSTQ